MVSWELRVVTHQARQRLSDILNYQNSSVFCISFTVLSSLGGESSERGLEAFLGSRSLCPTGLDFGAGEQKMRASIEVSSKDGKSLFLL